MHLSQLDAEVDPKEVRRSGNLEIALRELWTKARKVSELISSLRADNRDLQMRIVELEREIRKIRTEIETKDMELASVKDRYASAHASLESSLSNDEKEVLRLRIKELLTKLNSHLA
jgi:chromosome segregation ATPase